MPTRPPMTRLVSDFVAKHTLLLEAAIVLPCLIESRSTPWKGKGNAAATSAEELLGTDLVESQPFFVDLPKYCSSAANSDKKHTSVRASTLHTLLFALRPVHLPAKNRDK